MKKEKIILSFSALLIGLLVAGTAFLLYQYTREAKTPEKKTITINNPSPTPSGGLFLTIDSPKDEAVVDKRIIKITGKTMPSAKVVILSENSQEAATPGKDGKFSADINLNNSENIIEISAIAPNGEIVKVRRVVSYSTESF